MFAENLAIVTQNYRNIMEEDCSTLFDRFKCECRMQASLGINHCLLRVKDDTNPIIKVLNSCSSMKNKKHMRILYTRCIRQKMQSCGFSFHHCRIIKSASSFTISLGSGWKSSNLAIKQSNLILDCPICLEKKPVQAIHPCGHLSCIECIKKYENVSGQDKCPFCRCRMNGNMPIFQM